MTQDLRPNLSTARSWTATFYEVKSMRGSNNPSQPRQRMPTPWVAVPLSLVLICFVPLASSSTTQLTGAEIMHRVNGRSRGNASKMMMEMTIRDLKRGNFYKTIIMQRKRLPSGYRTGYWIAAPDHEKGIALLLSEDNRQHGMWMYFPASHQSLRVATRGFPALASDFSCEDLLVRIPLAEYEFRVVGRESIDGISTERVEMIPRTEELRSELGFTKSVGWVRDDIWMIVRADYYDENGEVFKRFTAKDVAQVQGIWTVRRFFMENIRVHHSSEVQLKEIDYSTRTSESLLTPEQFGTVLP